MVAPKGGQGSLIGETIGGFKVEALIGRGAMGAVYLARDVKLNRPVALKVLLGTLARTPSIVKQFHREAQAAAPLKHPGVVRVYSAGMERGTPYIAMEFVDGEPLDRFLKRGGRLGWQQALHVGGQVALALECAHSHGVVHRDVKPSNIMLDRSGNVRLTDFGIANIQSEDGPVPANSNIVGTPQYMSPEQCTGRDVGPASDLFALGVTMYQMMTAEMPFRGESSMALIKAICTEDPPRVNKIEASVPDDVARLVAYLIAKDPGRRPANARAVHSKIARLQDQKGGNSALPAALTAFIKEGMEPRPFSGVKKKGRTVAKAGTRASKILRRIAVADAFPWRKAGRYALIAGAGLAAMFVGPIMGTMAREGRADPAPDADFISFQRAGAGALAAHMRVGGFTFGRLAWCGDGRRLIAEAEGIGGTLTDGVRGLLALSPGEGRAVSLRSPPGQAFYVGGEDTVSYSFTGWPRVDAGFPLGDAVLVHAHDAANGRVITLAQPLTSALPSPAILASVPASAWPGNGPGARVAGIHPDGHDIALVLYDDLQGLYYIAERDVSTAPVSAMGPRRTGDGVRIDPASVRYSPDGKWIAYVRETHSGTRELWCLESGKDTTNGAILSGGIAGGDIAFSLDSRLAAVALEGTAETPAGIGVLDIATASLIHRVGPGILCPDAWLANGRQLIVAHPEWAGPLANTAPMTGAAVSPVEGPVASGQGARRLWRVDIFPPYRRTAVELPAGAVSYYAVSGDGESLAAALEGEAESSVAFVNLGLAGDNPPA